MYKCVDLETGEEIIILRPEWRKQLALLKRMDAADRLACQGCRQSVRVRAGEHKRWHFAHKHLANCSYGEASPRVLEARAVLFEWLSARYGMFATLEKDLGELGFPRPLDGWVDTGEARFGYWIVETRMRVPAREALHAACAKASEALGAPIHTVFLSDLLNEEPREPHSLYLTTTEREFTESSPFDAVWQGGFPQPGFSLHYLNPEGGALVTYRGLKLLHAPQWFKGHREANRLAAVLGSESGAFEHPGEAERLAASQAAIQARAERKQQAARAVEAWFRPREQPVPGAANYAPGASKFEPGASKFEPGPIAGSPAPRPISSGKRRDPEPAACVECGQITTEYWAVWTENDRRLCRCRECLRRAAPPTSG